MYKNILFLGDDDFLQKSCQYFNSQQFKGVSYFLKKVISLFRKREK